MHIVAASHDHAVRFEQMAEARAAVLLYRKTCPSAAAINLRFADCTALHRTSKYDARTHFPARHLRPRAEHGLNFMLPLYQRFAGWRRVVEYSSQRSTAAALNRYAFV